MTDYQKAIAAVGGIVLTLSILAGHALEWALGEWLL